MSIIKHVALQKTIAHDFRYDPRIKLFALQITTVGLSYEYMSTTTYTSINYIHISKECNTDSLYMWTVT